MKEQPARHIIYPEPADKTTVYLAFMTSDLSSPVDREAAILKAAAHPLRLQLIMLLRKASQGISVRQLQQQLAIDHNTVSHHLSLLRDKGIVTATPKSNERYYSLSHIRLAEAVSVLLEQ